VRIALGAEPARMLSMVLLDGLRPALLGLVLGVAASAVVTRLVASVLDRTSPLDPTLFVAVAATLLLTAGAACLCLAWRASDLDPMHALRSE
jgi:ABC-type lipoprotein release transport system permease subunit